MFFRPIVFCAVAALLFASCFVDIAYADLVLTTSTRDSADLDFDGSGLETNGDLSITTRAFSLTGADIPATAEFSNITSINIVFTASSGKTLSGIGAGIIPPGIGLTSPGELGIDINEMTDGVNEVLTISVSSTSTDPNEEVLLSGVQFNSWRNVFPVSEATLTGGATFDGGQTVLTGAGGVVPVLDFDSEVDEFSFESTGVDGIRLADIRLSVVSVPEPATGLLGGMLLIGMLVKRRRSLMA